MSNFYKVTTETDPLRLRSSCDTSTDSNILTKIPKGTVVEESVGILAVPKDGWKAITYKGIGGYASAKYLTPCDANGKTNGEPDKTAPVDEDTTSGGKKSGAKTMLIVGGVVVVAGVLMNVFM